MQDEFLFSLLGVAGFALSVVIVTLGLNRSLIRVYPLFYSYVVYGCLSSLSMWGFVLWIGTDTFRTQKIYYHLHTNLRFVTSLFEILILSKLYVRFRLHSDRWFWPMLGAATAAMGLFFLTHQIESIYRMFGPEDRGIYLAYQVLGPAILQFEVLFCALTLGHVALNDRIVISWNQFVIVSGFVISILFKYIGWRLFASNVIPYEELRPWIQPFDIISWIIWALFLRNQEAGTSHSAPPSALVLERIERYEEAVRTLLRR